MSNGSIEAVRKELENSLQTQLLKVGGTSLEEVADRGGVFVVRNFGYLTQPDEVITSLARQIIPDNRNPVRRIQVVFQPLNGSVELRGRTNYETVVALQLLGKMYDGARLLSEFPDMQQDPAAYSKELIKIYPDLSPMRWRVGASEGEVGDLKILSVVASIIDKTPTYSSTVRLF